MPYLTRTTAPRKPYPLLYFVPYSSPAGINSSICFGLRLAEKNCRSVFLFFHLSFPPRWSLPSLALTSFQMANYSFSTLHSSRTIFNFAKNQLLKIKRKYTLVPMSFTLKANIIKWPEKSHFSTNTNIWYLSRRLSSLLRNKFVS